MSAVFWKELIKKLVQILLPKATGIYAWIAELALKYGGQALLDLLAPILEKIKRAGPQKEALEKLEEVDKKPEATAEDVGKAYQDAMNAGREVNKK